MKVDIDDGNVGTYRAKLNVETESDGSITLVVGETIINMSSSKAKRLRKMLKKSLEKSELIEEDRIITREGVK